MKQRRRGSKRSSSLSTTQPSAAPAWVPSPKTRIPTRRLPRTPKTWTSSSLTGMCTRPSSTKWMAWSTSCLVEGALNKTQSFPVGRTSRCQRATRRTSIGRDRAPKRNTTTSLWTSSPDRRRSLRSIVSGRGRLNRSQPSSYSNEGCLTPWLQQEQTERIEIEKKSPFPLPVRDRCRSYLLFNNCSTGYWPKVPYVKPARPARLLFSPTQRFPPRPKGHRKKNKKNETKTKNTKTMGRGPVRRVHRDGSAGARQETQHRLYHGR